MEPLQAAAGLAVGGYGVLMIAMAAQVLGVARALFVHEYDPSAAAVVCRGIYTYLRHPMFLGGALVSAGCALLASDSTAHWIAAVNVSALAPYRFAEDSRCTRVFGKAYARYREAVDAFVPSVPGYERLHDAAAIEVQSGGDRDAG
jgi:protein-S-isoprenylcysteine O-methyltransferase Ste14